MNHDRRAPPERADPRSIGPPQAGCPGPPLADRVDQVGGDGTRLAEGGRDRSAWRWDLARGEEVAKLTGHTTFVRSLAFSPDGATPVSGSGDSTVRLWDTAPPRARYQARRVAEAERPVEALWRQKHDPAEVVEALRADRVLSEPMRQAALRAVLRRAPPPEAAPGNPRDPP